MPSHELLDHIPLLFAYEEKINQLNEC